MSETENQTNPAQPRWWHPTATLTPKGSAMAGFTLAGFSMLSPSAWTSAAEALFVGRSFDSPSPTWWLFTVVVAAIVPALLALLLARRTLTSPPPGDGWEVHLARAAVVIAQIGIVLGVIAALGNLIHS